MECIGKTHIGKVRKNNEDYYFVNGQGLFVLADGMGGYARGDIASRTAVEYIKKNYNSAKCICNNTINYLSEIVQDANRAVYNLSKQGTSNQDMGTTIIIAYLHEYQLYFAHVGDSRLYLYRDGKLTQLTRDHSLVEELLSSGEITPEEAINHPQKNLITRALGVNEYIEIDTGTAKLFPDDIILLCSDGLSNMLTDQQILKFISKEQNLNSLSTALIQAANTQGGTDNITVVIGKL